MRLHVLGHIGIQKQQVIHPTYLAGGVHHLYALQEGPIPDVATS